MGSVSFVVAVDQALQGDAEVPGGPTGVSHPVAMDPTGWVLLELGMGPDLALVGIDPEQVAVIRETPPMLDGDRLRSL